VFKNFISNTPKHFTLSSSPSRETVACRCVCFVRRRTDSNKCSTRDVRRPVASQLGVVLCHHSVT